MDKTRTLLIFFFLLINISAFAQQSPADQNIDAEFKLALNLFDASQFNDAYKIFDRIAAYPKLNSKTTAAYLLAAKALLKLNEFGKAAKTLNSLITKYPNSKYLDEARITLANALIEQKKYYDAFYQITFIIDKPDSSYYYDYARSSGEKIALNFLDTLQIKQLYNTILSQKIKSYVLLLLGKSFLKEGNYEAAIKAFSDIQHLYPNSIEKNEAASLEQKVNSYVRLQNPIIGIMLPLDTNQKQSEPLPGQEILAGIKYAVSQYNKSHNPKVGLVIRNTGRDKNKILQIKNEFAALPSLKAVIGPIYSNEVKDALEDFKDTNIPMISPTATEDDLTSLYQNFFQANPSFSLRGKTMAQYIYYVENKRNVAVLNASDGYSSILADAFVNEFEKLGGKIVIRESYKTISYKLGTPIANISALASNIDGIYIPLSDKAYAPVILSQMVQNNLDMPIYGNQDWFLAKGYETSSTLSNKLTFTSDYFIDFNASDYQQFSKNFSAQTSLSAGRNALYGYDVTKYLLTAMGNNDKDESSLITKMSSGLTVNGYHNNISFGSNRINRFLNIVRYRDGMFELIDKFKSGN